jgi:hypothetical protein
MNGHLAGRDRFPGDVTNLPHLVAQGQTTGAAVKSIGVTESTITSGKRVGWAEGRPGKAAEGGEAVNARLRERWRQFCDHEVDRHRPLIGLPVVGRSLFTVNVQALGVV